MAVFTPNSFKNGIYSQTLTTGTVTMVRQCSPRATLLYNEIISETKIKPLQLKQRREFKQWQLITH